VHLLEELKLIFERLSSVLGVDVQQRLIVQILATTRPHITIIIIIIITVNISSSRDLLTPRTFSPENHHAPLPSAATTRRFTTIIRSTCVSRHL